MEEKVLIDPSLAGKTREEMGLEPFIDIEIRSSIMGVPVFISQDIIAYVKFWHVRLKIFYTMFQHKLKNTDLVYDV